VYLLKCKIKNIEGGERISSLSSRYYNFILPDFCSTSEVIKDGKRKFIINQNPN
jgi:hypothetical protein